MSLKTGAVLKIVSASCMTLMAACVKGLDGQVHTGEVIFFRSVFALVPLFLWLGYQGNVLELIKTRNIGGHVVRGISGSCGMFLNFMTLAYLPLADAVVLGYAAPLIAVILAVILLKEAVRWYRWVGAIIGFAGVLVMQMPHFDTRNATGVTGTASLIGAGLGLTGACFSALSTVQVRRLASTETPGAVVLYFSLMTMALGLLTISWGWTMPSPPQLALLIGVGVFGGIGQTLYAMSLRYADASLIAPFEYTTMLWSVLIGYFLFNQVPALAMLVGGTIVAGAAIFTIWREIHSERTQP